MKSITTIIMGLLATLAVGQGFKLGDLTKDSEIITPTSEIERVVPAPTEPGTAVTLLEEKPLRTIPAGKPVTMPTEFELKIALVWGAPKSFFMRDLRKRIDRAKSEGDTATYEKLVAQYTTWANQGEN